MLFSSISFLYYFLPCILILYFVVPAKYRNSILLISSLIFYFYGEPIYILVMLGSILSAYIHGILIEKYQNYKKIFLITSIIISLGTLIIFKYSDFTGYIYNLNKKASYENRRTGKTGQRYRRKGGHRRGKLRNSKRSICKNPYKNILAQKVKAMAKQNDYSYMQTFKGSLSHILTIMCGF